MPIISHSTSPPSIVDELKFVRNGSAVEDPEGGGSGKCVVCVCVAYKLTYCKTQMSFGQIQQNHLKVCICTLHNLPLQYQTVVVRVI